MLLCLLFSETSQGQTTQKFIKVHFLYGSKPKKKFKHTEKPWFGGIKGGHVSIETEGRVVGFNKKGKFHVFANDKKRHSYYEEKLLSDWVKDTIRSQYLSIEIPITVIQQEMLRNVLSKYIERPPYDYAFFGMRCASSAYELLSLLDLEEKKGRNEMAIRYFYPKLLRTHLMLMAEAENYKIKYTEGRLSRKWEKDRRKARCIITGASLGHKFSGIMKKGKIL